MYGGGLRSRVTMVKVTMTVKMPTQLQSSKGISTVGVSPDSDFSTALDSGSIGVNGKLNHNPIEILPVEQLSRCQRCILSVECTSRV